MAATPGLITHGAIHKMTVHDGHRLADALDDPAERPLKPGDSHYGSADNMALTRVRGVAADHRVAHGLLEIGEQVLRTPDAAGFLVADQSKHRLARPVAGKLGQQQNAITEAAMPAFMSHAPRP